jgi:hypothetical protein
MLDYLHIISTEEIGENKVKGRSEKVRKRRERGSGMGSEGWGDL